MRALLLALGLTCTLAAQMVEESFARDPGPLDFIRGEGLEQAILQSLTGDALVGVDPGGKVVPRLCQKWIQVKGALRLWLRVEARFQDGGPVTPADVAWTLREVQTHPQASPTKKALLEGLVLTEGKGWVDLRSPHSPHRLLLELARIPIAKQGHPDLGSGPFALKRTGAEWRLEARPHFLKPQIEGLHFRLLPDDQALLQNLQKGWLSLGVPPARPGLAPPPTHRVLVQPTHAQLVLWHHGEPGLLRKFERWRGEAFPSQFFGEKARPSRGLWPESLGFPVMRIQGGESAASPTGPLELLFPAGDELVQRALLAIRARALKEGVEVVPTPVESALLYERLQKGAFRLACAVVLFDPHPWSVLEYLEPRGPMNFTGWNHPDLQSLLPTLEAPDSRAWSRVQSLWAQSPAALPLLDLQSVVWVDRRLEVQGSAMGLYLTTPGAAGWRWKR